MKLSVLPYPSAAFIMVVLAGCSRAPSTSTPDHDVLAAKTGGLFRDVARQAGINFIQSTGSTGHFYYPETTGGGCAFFDYDNDGFLDVLLIQSGPMPPAPTSDPAANANSANWCRLYHNNGDGTFTDVTAGSGLDRYLGYGQGITIGDYDNDGYDDIFVTGYGGCHLFRNEHGTGKFLDVTRKAGLTDYEHGAQYATSAAFGDYDNDGRLDLYVCHYAPWEPGMNKPCADVKGQRDYCSPNTLDPATSRLYHNNGNGTFTDVSASSGIASERGRSLAACWLDYDGDGRQDLFVVNDLSYAFLWHNDGHGKFSDRALVSGAAVDNTGAVMAGMGIGVGDYNNSGRDSLFVTNFSGQPDSLFQNVGGGQFNDVSVPSGVALPHMKLLSFGCDFIDYDADGWKDIITACGHVEVHAPDSYPGTTYAEPKQLLHNDGAGHFTAVTGELGDLGIPTVSRGLATGDYDNDGRVDFLVVNQNGPAQLFHNEDHSSNHWISFKTVGTSSNRDGYGARIRLTAGSRSYFSEIHSSSSYASHSDSRADFGLGTAARIDSVDVVWPSGTHDKLPGPAEDHSYILTEGRGITGVLPAARRAHP